MCIKGISFMEAFHLARLLLQKDTPFRISIQYEKPKSKSRSDDNVSVTSEVIDHIKDGGLE